VDDNSGQVLQAIRDAGIAENTLVVWTTDNGAWIDACLTRATRRSAA